MSDDEADPELVELLRQTLGLSGRPKEDEVSTDTGRHEHFSLFSIYSFPVILSTDSGATNRRVLRR